MVTSLKHASILSRVWFVVDLRMDNKHMYWTMSKKLASIINIMGEGRTPI